MSFTPAQRRLKLALAERENYQCPISGNRGSDLCHVFILKGRAGTKGPDRTYDEHNLVFGNHDVNMRWSVQDRLTAARYLIKLYTIETIQDWVDSLGLKSPFSVEGWISSLEQRTT